MSEVSPAATHAGVGVSRRPAASPIVLLFSITLFVSAFLLFLVEPIVARMILPILGGAPMVWNGCVLFFQILLLAGYAYTHGTNTWLGPRLSAAAYAVLLLVPFAFLPFVIDPGSATVEGHPLAWLLLVLLGTIGAPFFVLASTTSALQKAFSETSTDARRDPYFLYIASNAGSLLGLLSYPLLVEPNFTLAEQSRFWSIGYGAFVALALVCVATAWRMSRSHAVARPGSDVARPGLQDRDAAALTTRRRVRWVALSAIPSSLMLGVTGYLTTDIASFPLLWVVPLALYLLTFILAFAKPASSLAVADRRLPILLVTAAVFILLNVGAPIWLVLLVHLGTFVLAALLCHSALADDRPPASQLTEFYLWIAVGGVIGGVFNTLIAPVTFNNVAEYPIALVLAAFFRQAPANATESRSFAVPDLVAPAAIAILTFGSIVGLYYFGGPPNFAFYLPAVLCFQQLKHVRRFAMMVAALLLVGTVTPFGTVYGQVLMAQRTFFGVYRVSHHPSGRYITLYHGTTLHGIEARDPGVEHEPLVYFHREGPFGQAFSRLPNASTTPHVAVIGLGIGALASYAGPDQRWTFFEIDPFVEEVARDSRYFTHLRTCGARCDVVIGDARLSIERRPDKYGLLVLDAFSSDAIPVHLMTSEALDLYVSRLAPGGVLAFHISNRHLSLASVLGRLAAERGLTVLEQFDPRAVDLDERGMTTSNWLVMARDRVDLGLLTEDPRWTAPQVPAGTPLWTDDFSNILSVFRRE